MEVSTQQLRYFVALAEELSFTRAAARLFITQPALSKQIAQLEKRLKVELFVRGTRGTRLSPAGEALMASARQVLAAWDDAERSMVEAAQTGSAQIVLGFWLGIGRGLVPTAMSPFRASHPGANLVFRRTDWDDPSAGLASGEADAAILLLPLPKLDGVSFLPLMEEPLHVAVPANHPLADQETVDVEQIIDETFLSLPRECGPLRNYALLIGRRDGRYPTTSVEVRNIEEAMEAVENGLGIQLISHGTSIQSRRPGVEMPWLLGYGTQEYAIGWRSDDRRVIVSEFVEAMVHAAQRLPRITETLRAGSTDHADAA